MTTLNLQVAASTDDAWQNATGTVDTTGLIIGSLSTGNMWAGFRFNNVTVPQGVTINTATLQLYVNTTASDDLVADFYCEAADDAGTFTTGASDISGRSRTTAKVSVSASAVGLGWYSVTGLAAAVEEVTDRGGWSSGNDLVIILDALPGVSFQCRTWDFDTSLAAKLTIDYTAGAPQSLTGAFITAGTALYAGALKLILAGATIAAGTTMYAGTITPGPVTLTGATIAAGTTLYAGTVAPAPTILTGAHIAAGTTLYSGAVNAAGQTLTGAHIASTSALYAGAVHRGAAQIAAVTHYEGAGISAASFDHTTPAGDDRLLVVVAVYKDTAGVASLVFGSSGAGDGELNGPKEIAITPDDYVYVVDGVNHRIQKFDTSGNYVSQFGSNGSGNGEFSFPTGIALDSDGNIYVVDTLNHRVQKFNSSGSYVTQWGSIGSGNGQFSVPRGIAIDANDNLYVVDTNNDRIQKFDTSGNYVSQFGAHGSAAGEFDAPYGVTTDSDGNIYVADYGNYRVQVFDSGGVFLFEFGERGTASGQFRTPQDIAISASGNIYVADYENCRVQVFDRNGDYVAKWGTFGGGDGQFRSVRSLAFDSSGAVYVSDIGNNRIQKFDANLKLNTARYGGEEMAVGPLVDSGSYFVAFYTLENPPVGAAEVAFAAPTEPDIIMLTAISLNGVDTASTDYTGPDAGMAEQETHTTQLQVSHNRTYPTNTLSLWAALYESAGTTLTGASGNHVWIERNVGNLRLALGLRPIPAATSGSITFGAVASPAVTPRISSVLHIEGARGNLAGAFIDSGSTLYAGGAIRTGQYLTGATIASGSTLYAGTVQLVMAGATIASTTTLYGGSIEAIPGEEQFLLGVFIGLGQPRVLNGAYLDAATELFAGVVSNLSTLEGAYIEEGSVLYEGVMSAPVNYATGALYPGTIAHV